jgi:hypothetical protein
MTSEIWRTESHYLSDKAEHRKPPPFLVSLVSVRGGNWCYICGIVEGVETDEIVEFASIHAAFTHVAEKMVG